MELSDIPMIDRTYTWYNANDNAMSRLDRILVSCNNSET